MLVASTLTSSGAYRGPSATTSSAQAPSGPESTSAATSSDASTTELNADQPRDYAVFAPVTPASGTRACAYAPAQARYSLRAEPPCAQARSAGTLAWTCPVRPRE